MIRADRIAIFGGSFNPPHLAHLEIVRELRGHFKKAIIIPCGGRPDKASVAAIDPVHRAAMVQAAFSCMPGVEINLFDLQNRVATPSIDLDKMFRRPMREIWHVVGSDLIAGGETGTSLIQREWVQGETFWNSGNFAVIERPGFECTDKDMPPNSKVIGAGKDISSSAIQAMVKRGEDISHLVPSAVAKYIRDNKLYLT